MKLSATCLILSFLFAFTNLNGQITIGEPISVTDGDNSFSYRTPKVEVNGNGEPVILWVKPGSSEALYVSRKTGTSFTEPVSIPLGGINPNVWSGNLGPDLAVWENHVYVVFEKYGEAIYLSHSADYGDTWDEPIAAFDPPDGRVATIPNVAVDVNGNPLVAYVNTNQSEEDAHYGMVKSTDFGSSFSSEVQVNLLSEGAEVCECCNGDITVADNGDVYVAFRNNNENLRDCWISRSVDGGESFTLLYDMDETDWTVYACPSNGPNVYVNDNQAVLTFYTASADWENGVYYTALDLNADEIGTTTSIPFSDENSSYQSAPRIAGGGDIIGIVTQETISGVASVAMSISFNGADGLQNESFQLFESSTTQRYPAIVFHDNIFHVVYEHSQTGTVNYQEVYVGPNSIADLEENIFSIYPNPSSDFISIDGLDLKNESVDIEILDLSGKTLMRKSINANANQVSLTGLESGAYVIMISQDGNEYFSKLIIAN